MESTAAANATEIFCAAKVVHERADHVVGCDLTLLCFETLGGFSAEVVELLHELARERDNKLTPAEYEETTWSARTWTTFAAQKISVALHYAAAFEISMALRVPKFDQAELDAAAARRMAGGG